MWDLGAGKQLSEFRDHTAPVTVVKFHPNEFFLASASVDRYLCHVALLSCVLYLSKYVSSVLLVVLHLQEYFKLLQMNAKSLMSVWQLNILTR